MLDTTVAGYMAGNILPCCRPGDLRTIINLKKIFVEILHLIKILDETY